MLLNIVANKETLQVLNESADVITGQKDNVIEKSGLVFNIDECTISSSLIQWSVFTLDLRYALCSMVYII